MSIPLREYWQLLADYLKPQKWRVALLTVLLFGVIGLRIVNPLIIRGFLDSAQAGGALDQLLISGGLFLLFALLVQGMSIAATYVGELVGWTATNNLRADMALHALRLDMSFHNDKTPGEMIERIDGDVIDLAIFFSQLVIQVIGNSLLLIGVLVALAREDWRVGIVVTTFSMLALFTLGKLRDIAVPHWKVAREAHADLYGYIEEQLSGTEDIRSSGATDYVMRGLYENGRKVYVAESRAGIKGIGVWLAWQFWHVVGRMVAFIAGYLLFTHNLITLGTAYLFVYYVETIFGPLRHLTMQMERFQKAAGSIMRLRELKALESKITDDGTAVLPARPLGVRFANVNFGYNEHDLVLKDVSFSLSAGRVLGVLGRTGSGKTTIARLLFRLYDVTSGEIRLAPDASDAGETGDGGSFGSSPAVDRRAAPDINVRDLPLGSLPHHIGIVTQDVQLFRATVRQNLTLFDTTIPDARILDVIRDLQLTNWFEGLPEGLDTEIDGGKALSAGEGQLLAFARVFLRNPGLVILDEASSRLDPATERRIEHAIDRLFEGGEHTRTAIIIAHRLDTVQRADDILILDDGRVAEHGSREALLRNPDSRFSQLLRAASMAPSSAASLEADLDTGEGKAGVGVPDTDEWKIQSLIAYSSAVEAEATDAVETTEAT